MTIQYIVISIGCIECGVSSIFIGNFDNKVEAEAAADAIDKWRDSGQCCGQVFEVPLP